MSEIIAGGNMKKLLSILVGVCLAFSFAGCGGDGNDSSSFDYTKLPFYSEEAVNGSYSYTEEERVRPFWLGNTVYNESVMCLNENGFKEATTMFKPIKVIAVYDWTMKKEYKEGEDWTLTEEGKIRFKEESEVPVFNDNWAYGKDMPTGYTETDDNDVTLNKYRVFDCIDQEGNTKQVIYHEGPLFYSYNLNVTYVYDPAEFNYDCVKSYAGELTGLNAKLANKEDIKMVILGDSISEGCSASKHWNRDPFSPFYGELVKNELERVYGTNVNMTNMSVGGKTSKWGAGVDTSDGGGNNLPRIREIKPDLLVISFGMNDVSSVPAAEFQTYIRKIADTAREANENCQLIFLNSYPGQKDYVRWDKQKAIGQAFEEVSYEYADCLFINMFPVGEEFLKTKRYYEITNNGVNHPNDFMHRVYAMNVLSGIIDYSSLNK